MESPILRIEVGTARVRPRRSLRVRPQPERLRPGREAGPQRATEGDPRGPGSRPRAGPGMARTPDVPVSELLRSPPRDGPSGGRSRTRTTHAMGRGDSP